MSEVTFATIIAFYGALTASLDFLTGAIPASVCVFFMMLALDGGETALIRRRAITGLLWFLLTGLLCFALKMACVMGVWGWGELKPFTDELAVRMGHSVDLSAREQAMLAPYGITSEMLSHTRVLAAAYAFAKVAHMMPIMAWGARGISILALGTSVMVATVALAISGWRLGSGAAHPVASPARGLPGGAGLARRVRRAHHQARLLHGAHHRLDHGCHQPNCHFRGQSTTFH
ncbi:hypothetical protein UCD39_03175 [Nitrospirillum sp. BR 11752]|uniref:hypothetical protein n=1 Tax=Nitrospirillum sp. BR 11752 TaxID=3104293 RepID=UPI002EA365C9|nr:hypothetical protein [Nitrospirillum sp. BR 11752]